MILQNIKLAKSALTDNIYVGYVDKTGKGWKDKKDVTDEFISCVIARWAGFKETLTSSDGDVYEITVKKKNAK